MSYLKKEKKFLISNMQTDASMRKIKTRGATRAQSCTGNVGKIWTSIGVKPRFKSFAVDIQKLSAIRIKSFALRSPETCMPEGNKSNLASFCCIMFERRVQLTGNIWNLLNLHNLSLSSVCFDQAAVSRGFFV